MDLSRIRKTFPTRLAMPMRDGAPDIGALLARSRAEFGAARMEADDDDPPDPPDPTAGLSRDEHGNLVVPQAVVTRLLADEKRQGRRSGIKKLLDKFGVKDETELAALVEAGKKKPTETPPKKTGTDAPDDDSEAVAELRRKLADSEQKLAAQDEERRKEREAAHKNRVKAALRDAGVTLTDKGRVPDDILRMVDVPVDADDEDVEDAVDQVKERWPALFEGVGETVPERRDRSGGAPTSHGPGPKPQPPVKIGSLEAGRKKARERLGLDKQQDKAGV